MEQLGRYLLERKLAQGGMAEVFLARQVGPGGDEKPCVVKRMLGVLSEDVTFVEMFLDEARVAAQLAHPGIAQIIDFGHESDTYYLAMEYVPGANLKTVLEARFKARRHVPLQVAARVTSLVAQALDYAHHKADEKGRPLEIVHRDVSPHNVMVSVTGDVKLIDFGIAKAATDSHRTAVGTLKGKYGYMSPEQLRQKKVDRRTDVYALGLVFYELLTCRPAVPHSDNLNAMMMAAAERKYAPLESLRPETPKRLRAVLDKALALSVDDRFQTAKEMSVELEDWLRSGPTRVKPSELAELATDPSILSTQPGSPAAPPVPEPPRTVPDPVLLERIDPSLAETPIVGTEAVARRTLDTRDGSLVPTEPERRGPDIAKVMAMTRAKLGEAPDRRVENSTPFAKTAVSRTPSSPRAAAPKTERDDEPRSVITEPARSARKWPWVALAVVLALALTAWAAVLLR